VPLNPIVLGGKIPSSAPYLAWELLGFLRKDEGGEPEVNNDLRFPQHREQLLRPLIVIVQINPPRSFLRMHQCSRREWWPARKRKPPRGWVSVASDLNSQSIAAVDHLKAQSSSNS
jgi:hypothetical protein